MHICFPYFYYWITTNQIDHLVKRGSIKGLIFFSMTWRKSEKRRLIFGPPGMNGLTLSRKGSQILLPITVGMIIYLFCNSCVLIHGSIFLKNNILCQAFIAIALSPLPSPCPWTPPLPSRYYYGNDTITLKAARFIHAL